MLKTLRARKWFWNVTTLIICFVATTCIFTALTLLHGLIPTSLTEKNMLSSLAILDSEGNYVSFKDAIGIPLSFAGQGNKVDNFANMWMIQSADSEHFFDSNEFLKGETYNPENREYIEGSFAVQVFSSSWKNGNYWSGYRVFFKPLMIFFDVWGLRIIQIFLIVISIVWVFLSIRNNIGLIEAILLIIAVLAVNPLNILLGFCQGPDLIQALLSSVTVLWLLRKNIRHRWILAYFLFLGMIEIFINCLIMPMVTLGVPLITYLLYQQKKKTDLKKQFIDTIALSFAWGCGYVGTFLSSWTISALFKHVSPLESIKDGISGFILRSGGKDESLIKNIAYSVHNNINLNIPFLWLIILFALVIAMLAWRNHEARKHLFTLMPFVLASIFPFMWIILLNNHSLNHAFMVHDIFIVSIWGFLLFIYNLMGSGALGLAPCEKK